MCEQSQHNVCLCWSPCLATSAGWGISSRFASLSTRLNALTWRLCVSQLRVFLVAFTSCETKGSADAGSALPTSEFEPPRSLRSNWKRAPELGQTATSFTQPTGNYVELAPTTPETAADVPKPTDDDAEQAPRPGEVASSSSSNKTAASFWCGAGSESVVYR